MSVLLVGGLTVATDILTLASHVGRSFQCCPAEAAEAVACARSDGYALTIIDTESDENAFQLCAVIRAHSQMPIIVVAMDNAPTTVVRALHNGADVCLPRPVDSRELVARARALTRRRAPRLPLGDHLGWRVDLTGGDAVGHGRAI